MIVHFLPKSHLLPICLSSINQNNKIYSFCRLLEWNIAWWCDKIVIDKLTRVCKYLKTGYLVRIHIDRHNLLTTSTLGDDIVAQWTIDMFEYSFHRFDILEHTSTFDFYNVSYRRINLMQSIRVSDCFRQMMHRIVVRETNERQSF